MRISAPAFQVCAPCALFTVAVTVCEVIGLMSAPNATSTIVVPSKSRRGKYRLASGTSEL